MLSAEQNGPEHRLVSESAKGLGTLRVRHLMGYKNKRLFRDHYRRGGRKSGMLRQGNSVF